MLKAHAENRKVRSRSTDKGKGGAYNAYDHCAFGKNDVVELTEAKTAAAESQRLVLDLRSEIARVRSEKEHDRNRFEREVRTSARLRGCWEPAPDPPGRCFPAQNAGLEEALSAARQKADDLEAQAGALKSELDAANRKHAIELERLSQASRLAMRPAVPWGHSPRSDSFASLRHVDGSGSRVVLLAAAVARNLKHEAMAGFLRGAEEGSKRPGGVVKRERGQAGLARQGNREPPRKAQRVRVFPPRAAAQVGRASPGRPVSDAAWKPLRSTSACRRVVGRS